MKKTSSKLFVVPYMLWIALFVLAPLVLIFGQSFFNIEGQFSLENYKSYFASQNLTYLKMSFNSVLYAGIVTFVALLISYPTALFLTRLKHRQLWLMLIILPTWINLLLKAYAFIGTFGAIYIYQSRKKYQEAFLSLNNILMVAPDVMIGASFLILFTQLKFSLGFLTVLSSHVAFSIPIVVLMVLPRLKEMNGDMIHAAYDLGASQFQMFKEIMLPYLTPSIITGYFMAFTYSLDDFAVTFFVTGNGFSTLSVEIYSRARKGISLEINALSALVFLFSIILVVGYYFISREKEEQA